MCGIRVARRAGVHDPPVSFTRFVTTMRDNGAMRIQTDFTTIPDAYAKHAPEENKIGSHSIVSFPFAISDLPADAQYLHWELVDDDAIAVGGFQWIHWCAANVPVGAIMYDFHDSTALRIPEDFSRTMPSMIPEAVQGRNSYASPMVGETNPAVTQRYVGPNPPDKDHEYMLSVWATSAPIPDIKEGFWLNQLRNAMRTSRTLVAFDSVWLLGKA